MASEEDFYVRCYVGHKGKFGHEFIEFELRPDGLLRYANNSRYKDAKIIRKEMYVEMSVIDEAKSMIQKSGITQESDARWPSPNSIGRQELEVVIGDQHISFVTSKLHRLMDVHDSNDPDGLSAFYFLTGDLRWLIFTLIGVHFKIKPI